MGGGFRGPGEPLLPPEPGAFPAQPGSDQGPLAPGMAVSTELNFDDLQLRPQHAVAIASPDTPNGYWIILSEAPVPAQQLRPGTGESWRGPALPDLKANVIVIVTAMDQSNQLRARSTGLLRHDREPHYQPRHFALGTVTLIDDVIYGLYRGEELHLRFAAPVPHAE